MNYYKMKCLNPFKCKYVYIDSERFYSEEMFKINNIRIKNNVTFSHNKFTGARVILCTIRRKDEQKFLACIKELDKKMQILLGREYKDICEDTIATFKQHNYK